MNNDRRKSISKLHDELDTLKSALEDLRDQIDTLKGEEEDGFNNLPEGLQQAERGQAMEEATNQLQTAYDAADSAVSSLDEALTALHDLEKAMRGASDCYHGRNFQTVRFSVESQQAAQRAWHERFEWLSQFEREIEDMRLAIQQKEGM